MKVMIMIADGCGGNGNDGSGDDDGGNEGDGEDNGNDGNVGGDNDGSVGGGNDGSGDWWWWSWHNDYGGETDKLIFIIPEANNLADSPIAIDDENNENEDEIIRPFVDPQKWVYFTSKCHSSMIGNQRSVT